MKYDISFQGHRDILSGLPPPDALAQAHSAQLQRLIAEEIRVNDNRISFARFMELALYAPGLGYYSNGSHKLGAQGDFITAPEISSLFSRCLARQVAQVLTILGGGDVLEVGAGSGAMAVDLLKSLAAVDCLPRRYFILERSADLRARQEALFLKQLPALENRITWLEQLPESGFRGVILANELLDALPVHCFAFFEEGSAELYVTREHNQWRWGCGAPSSAELAVRIERLRRDLGLSAGYISEINLAAEAWIRSIADVLAVGMLLLIDYGFPRREYYHPQRVNGTLMCHYRHLAHGDPFFLVGLQDITAHVDFTAVAEAAYASGMEVAGYTTQAAFLLALGIADIVSDAEDELTCLQWAQQVKKLTLPNEMGELYKVLALVRGLDEFLLGFTMSDMRGRL